MSAFWAHFEDRGPGCIKAVDRVKAMELANALGDVTSLDGLPYPASPILATDDTDHCPPFCFRPEECKGRSACPRQIACSE